MNLTVLGWAYLGVGSVLIAAGGLAVTKGWNTLAARDQQFAAVRAVAHEVSANDRLIVAALELARRWPIRLEPETFSYERYHEVPIATMIAAGALDPQDPQDLELRQSLDEYQQAVAQFNAGMVVVQRFNPGMFLKTDFIHVTDAKQWPKDVGEVLSEKFRTLLQAHRLVQERLRARFPGIPTA